MREIRLLVWVMLFGLMPVVAFAQNPFHDNLEKIAAGEANENQSRIEDAGVQANTANYDLKYLNIKWRFNIVTGQVNGHITYHFAATAAIDTIEFDCSQVLQVDSVVYHGQLITNFMQAQWVLKINPPVEIANSANDSITVIYHGIPQGTGLDSYTLSSHNGDSLLCTLSEPYGARDWWPCKMTLNDKIDSLDIAITVTSNFKAGTAGLLKHTDLSGGEATYHWKTRYPIACYLIGVSTYPYLEVDHKFLLGSDSLLVQNYIYPDYEQSLLDFIPTMDSAFYIYNNYFGQYPFIKEKYGHAQWWRLGGGMEHQTMSFVGDFDFELVVHELAHQWFGDRITCGSWQDIWLNEGFATYCTGLCYEHTSGGYWFKPFRIVNHRRAVLDSSGSVFVDDTTDVNRIFSSTLTYSKGFYMLTMLRRIMGDSAFFAALKSYANDPLLEFGFARTNDLKQHLEAAYGSSLDQFFNEWFYGKGFPIYHLYWHQVNDSLSFNLYQTQSDPSVSFFHIPLPVTFYGNGVDTTVILNAQTSGQQYSFHLSFAVDSIVVDPDLWTLSRNNEIVNGALAVNSLQANESSIGIFPNPANEVVTLSHKIYNESISEVRIYDPLGRLVISLNNLNIMPFDAFPINIDNLENGVYFIRMSGKNDSYTKKLVKNNP